MNRPIRDQLVKCSGLYLWLPIARGSRRMGSETTVGGGGQAVLEDPTGRRALWLRRVGRCVFLLFLGWLLAIVLGGLGLMPIAAIPFTHILRPSQGPPALVKLPQPRQPSRSDLQPAVPAKVFAARVRRAGRAAPRSAIAARGHSSTTPGHAGARGHSSTAPGQAKTTPSSTVLRGRSSTAPRQTRTTPSSSVLRGRSSTAPGQTTTTSTVRSKKP